jgi:bla regulator protein blaR1
VIVITVISRYRLSRGLLAFAAWWSIFFAGSGAAQLGSPGKKPALTSKDAVVDLAPLSVVTIKPVRATDSDPMTTRFSDDGVSFQSVTLAWVVQQAFIPQPSISIQDDLILGLPTWTKSERYDVEAKVDDEDVPKWKALSLSQKKLALQPLLVTRFNLQFHHDTRDRPTYSLIVAKNGPKLHKAQLSETYSNSVRRPDGPGGSGESTITPGKIVIRSGVSTFANLLSSQGLDHAVVDKTGLTDVYDITLRWSPDDIGSSDASLPSLFTALQEQLGLKLEYNKNPTDVIVIDHIEQPSAN